MSKFGQKLDNYFGISERKSKFSTEIIAGVTTFLAMAYIIIVNPNLLTNGGVADLAFVNGAMWQSIYIATIIGAVVGTLLMGLYAKLPFAQASGMGLNAFVFFSLMLPGVMSYGSAMKIILFAGVLFILLTLFGVREKLLNAVPEPVRLAIPVGIGLFIAFIGFQNASIIIADAGTKVALQNFSVVNAFTDPQRSAIVAILGLLLIAILSKLNIKGAIFIGILATTIIAMPFGLVDFAVLKGDVFKWYPDFGALFSGDEAVSSLAATWKNWGDFGDLFSDFGGAISIIILILSFCMIDMFDTFGTLYATTKKADLFNEDGSIPSFKEALLSDAIATVAGAAVGTSTVTTYVESAAGVSVGGRTGLTAVVVACFFILALFLTPLFALIPSAATAPALIYVGVLMMSTIKDIDFTDVAVAVPAFLTIVIMPFGYSITEGIGLGIISFCVIELATFTYYACTGGKTVQTVNEDGTVTESKVPVKLNISILAGVIAVLYLIMFLFSKY